MASHPHDPTHHPSPHPGQGRSIGERLQRRWVVEQLESAFATATRSATSPRSIGVLEVGRADGRPVASWLDALGPDLVLRIRRSLPRDGRLAFADGPRFVVALPGDPLLEALLVMDRVRDALERDVWSVDGEDVALVFDAGVATRRDADESLAATLDAAERSLRQARTHVVRRPGSPSGEQSKARSSVSSSPRLPHGWSKAADGPR